jgi:Holliday junction resolvase-like predicted endonuclease
MENMLKIEIGGYLTKLQNDYGIITRHQPLFAKSSTRGVRYELDDIFLRFWFRFIYRYDYMVELGAFDKLRTLVMRDYPTYSGKILEQYFMEVLRDSGRYTRMGNWYDRKGENEIDIIAADDLSQTVDFIEVKRQRKELDMDLLRKKADVFFKATGQYTDYHIQYRGMTMEDMELEKI